ncbi:hypothetical protein PF005_g2912 [Phytophthora fragariae]|uniref:GAG-pre-integrase domain-containing protein n=1 Tax=Phytophthora fragariae TaxID=53985 RepID=A0A6A3TLS9_9STRA|nr:hypothetical protein PF009_g3068 [Phytophthora fragariae]KAE9016175.1 hypothetical protein PF011_g7274 [Phytophthora fragariae]KAE9113250.1 hypothetical protein PF010_g10156 [Phytophthora fragariae]KAE9139697.1 hypothetical protein PF007_g911 [Phytophthora fragariae]KAE9153430.1 hypothetical protein PF006_g2434 [Phytophthora fragariae]
MHMVNATSNTLPDAALMVREAPHVETWHRRLGHLNQQSLNHLLTDLNLPWHGVMERSCPTCVSGKLVQRPFPSKDKRVLKKNQLLSLSTIWGRCT